MQFGFRLSSSVDTSSWTNYKSYLTDGGASSGLEAVARKSFHDDKPQQSGHLADLLTVTADGSRKTVILNSANLNLQLSSKVVFKR